jgi:hypothetical protein
VWTPRAEDIGRGSGIYPKEKVTMAKEKKAPIYPTLFKSTDMNGTVNSLTVAMSKLLPVNEVKNIADAELLINMSLTIGEKLDLKKCRTLKKVGELSLVDNVEKWAKSKFGIGRSAFYNYLKVADLVTDDGEASIFKCENGDFSYSVLLKLITALKDVKEIQAVVNQGIVTPFMSARDVDKVLKKYLAPEAEAAEEKAEAAEEKAEVKKEKEKLYTVKLTAYEIGVIAAILRNQFCDETEEYLFNLGYKLEQLLVK